MSKSIRVTHGIVEIDEPNLPPSMGIVSERPPKKRGLSNLQCVRGKGKQAYCFYNAALIEMNPRKEIFPGSYDGRPIFLGIENDTS